MKVEIADSSPDGLTVTFKDSFYFDTYEDSFKFIKAVEDVKRQIHLEAKSRVADAVKKMKAQPL